MSPATWPRENPLTERLLWIDPKRKTLEDKQIQHLSDLLRPGDLLVVNDAATLPASLKGKGPGEKNLEIRLLRHMEGSRFLAVLFGEGDWRSRTEDRPLPLPLWPGDIIVFGEKLPTENKEEPLLSAVVEEVPTLSYRLLTIRFHQEGAALFHALYRLGRPVQYSYLKRDLSLWHVQTSYSGRPWAMELPSAGRPLTWGLLRTLQQKGVRLATLTHAAGLSSTGDAILDTLLPFPESFEIPEETVEAIRETKAKGGRVIAVGTTVVRALEGAALLYGGTLKAGAGETDLIIQEGFPRQVVDGILSGMHEPGESHFRLLQSFAPLPLLEKACRYAERQGYLGHEFGDSTLVLAD